jgi:hypothetical protein
LILFPFDRPLAVRAEWRPLSFQPHHAPSRRMTLIDPLDALAVAIPQAKKRPQRSRN